MSTETSTYARLIASLDDLRRRWWRLRLAQGAAIAVAATLAALVVAVALDNLLAPGAIGRGLLGLAIVAAAAVASAIGAARLLEDRREDHFAMMVERAHPEVGDRLINAVQLGKGTETGVSPGLIRAIVSDGDRATADLDWGASLDRRPFRNGAIAAGVVGVVMIGYATVLPERFSNGLARVARPWADITAFTATRIDDTTIRPGDARVPEGASLAFEATLEGVVPRRGASVVLASADGSTRTVPLVPITGSPNRVKGIVPDLRRSLSYRISAGDGRSRAFHVEVVPRPKLARIEVSARSPKYAGNSAARALAPADGEVSALVGSTIDLAIVATKPLKSAELLTERGDAIALTGSADRWSARFAIWSSAAKGTPPASPIESPARYRIRLVDRDGFEDESPVWHAIAARPDSPPTVAIVVPGRDLAVKPDASVPLAVEARDDFGLANVRILYRVNDAPEVRELARFDHSAGAPAAEAKHQTAWTLSSGGLKPGDVLSYWAEATDRNDVTGPGRSESRKFMLALVAPASAVAKLETLVSDYAQAIEELARLQRENRAQTASGAAADGLVTRQAKIRGTTRLIARAMEKDALPTSTIVKALDTLYAGLMAKALGGLETLRDNSNLARSDDLRKSTIPTQDAIIAELDAILARLQKNEQAKAALRRLAKTDKPAHDAIAKQLDGMVKDLSKLLDDRTELGGKFERLPKKGDNDTKDDPADAAKQLDEMRKAWNAWAKGAVNELAKLPTGFVDDFGLRPDVNKIFEEIEKAAQRPKAEKIEVSLEDLGTGLEDQATKMKEDLEMWMPDAPDAAKWVLEEPLNQKGMKIPEMALPKALEDMVGDLLQEADEFDEEADDKTSAWGANLDQAGWGVGDGPISTFSAKGKTGNDLPNNMELGGRSGDGRRGKSSGQAVGETSRALKGRKTPARVGAEPYEPGRMKQEAQDDPNGVTGGGKKAGAGRKGLQGGTPPDISKDMGRLSEKQAGLREKAEQVAKALDSVGVPGRRLDPSIAAMKRAESDLKDGRYEDAARHRKEAMTALRNGLSGLDRTTAARLSRSRDLPPELRKELLQSSDEGYPPGYEALLKSYYKTLSAPEK